MDMQSLKSHFHRDGFIFIPQFFNEEEHHSLIKNIERYIENIAPKLPNDKVLYEASTDISHIKQMFNMAAYDPYFADLLWSSRFQTLATALLGERVDRGFVEYFNKPPRNNATNKESGKPTPPQQDCYYFMLTPPQALTFWIPLEDVDEDTGCLRYVKGTHNMGMRPHGRTQTLGFSQGIIDYGSPQDMENEVAILAKSGDLLAHHGMTIHRADGNTSRTRSRKVVGLVYFGETGKEDIKAKDQYQEQLRKEMKKSPGEIETRL